MSRKRREREWRKGEGLLHWLWGDGRPGQGGDIGRSLGRGFGDEVPRKWCKIYVKLV